MRTRFLAAAGRPEVLDRLIEARGWSAPPSGWTQLLRTPDLFILAEAEQPALVFPGGAVLGTLFNRGTAHTVERPDSRLGHGILNSRGQCLVDDHWGAWFAIFAEGGRHWALRDPSPFAPAYYRTDRGLSVYYSDLEAALELDPGPGGADLEFLRQWLAFPHLRTARTGLVGMTELLPGCRREIGPAVEALTLTWDPWTFASGQRQLFDFEAASEQVRSETLRTVAAQVRGRGRLLLELSGGLDSSVVAASLKACELPFMSVNFATRTAEGDERHYARAVAAMASARHFEIGEGDATLSFAFPNVFG